MSYRQSYDHYSIYSEAGMRRRRAARWAPASLARVPTARPEQAPTGLVLLLPAAFLCVVTVSVGARAVAASSNPICELLVEQWNNEFAWVDAWVEGAHAMVERLPALLRASQAVVVEKLPGLLQASQEVVAEKLPALLQASQAVVAEKLPELLQRAYTVAGWLIVLARELRTNMATRLTGLAHELHTSMAPRLAVLAHNARSISGTPACPTADCISIAAGATRVHKFAQDFFKATLSFLFTLAVVIVVDCANKCIKKLVRGVARVVTAARGKCVAGAVMVMSCGKRVSGAVTAMFRGGWVPRRASLPASPPPPPPLAAAKRLGVRRQAEDASVLLELFSRAAVDGGSGDVADEHREMVVQALRDVLNIKRALRIVCPEMDGARDGGLCIVCCDGVADMVVLPCKHLALCAACCDTMMIRERGVAGHGAAKCPICRTLVTDRMKIFRG